MANSLLDRIVSTLFTKKTAPKSRMRSEAKLPGSSKRHTTRKLRSAAFPALLIAAALAFGTQTASAASIYWNAQTGKWEVAANWNVGSQTGTTHQVPGASDYAYIDNGGSVQVDTTVDTVSYLVVGYSGTGVLNILNGGTVKTPFSSNPGGSALGRIYLGSQAGSSGTITIDGFGSLLDCGSNLYVGNSGTGVLNLTGGGKATSANDIYVGSSTGSSGTVTVDGNGSELKNTSLTGWIVIGYSGTGVLNLTGGGKATSANDIYLGRVIGSSGTVTVGGTNSLLENTGGALHIGYSGTGVLNLTGGGKATSANDIYLGRVIGSSGTVTVDGTGSELNSGNYLYVGDSGTGVLNLTDGGKATSASRIYLGGSELASGGHGTVTVDGNGSELSGNFLFVGYSGTGVLNLTGGGKATSASDIALCNIAGSSGTVTVDGNGSELKNNSGNFFVGYSGTGVLNLTGGGKATSAYSILLGNSTGSSGTVTVDGAGSELKNNTDHLYVGYRGTGVLNLTGGGKATSANDIYIGFNAGSSGTVMVGSGSTLSTGTNVYVGGSNTTGLLAGTGTVTAGGSTGVRVFNGSTLSAGDFSGQIGTLTINGNLDMQNGSTLRVDLPASGSVSDKIQVNGNATLGVVPISLSNLRTGSFTVLSSTGTLSHTPAVVFLNGEVIQNSAGRRAAGLYYSSVVSGNDLVLTLSGTAPANAVLTWDSTKTGDQAWNLTDANWTGHASGQFLDGDWVIFNSGGANITLGGTGKTVADMSVSNATDWTFNGNILADGTKTTLSGRTGRLNVDSGTVTLNGENEFMGGIILHSPGTIVLVKDLSLGRYVTGETKGQVTATGGTIRTLENRTISNRFNVTNGLTFDVAADKTLTVSYVDAGTEYGGALAKSGTGTLNVGSGVVFDHNSARRGGAVYVNAGTVNLTGTVFSYNSASTDTAGAADAANGGAVYVGGGTVNLGGVTFSNNSVTATNTTGIGYAHGGALYMAGGTVTFTGDTLFEGNKSAHTSGLASGGAIYYTGGTLKFNGDTVFSKNYARGNAGTFYVGADLDLSSSTGSLTFTGNSASYGGGIYASSSLTLGDHATFTGNRAGDDGGGIYSSSSLALGDHATFTGNTAYIGGGIYAGSLTLGDHATFTGNSASYGGGIYASSSLTLGDHATFTGNRAGFYGGGIYASSSLTLGDHATFTGNSAGSYGGGIRANSSLTLGDHATFTGNTANGDAGGIYAGSVTLGGNTLFENNLAQYNGGAIYLWGGSTSTLNADGGAIAFTGNKSGVTFTGGKPVDGTGTANSIHLRENTLLALTGSGNIYFDDPISGSNNNNTLTKSGTGFVQFVGDSYLNRTASHTYDGGTVTVSGGAFRVVENANFTTYGNAATFTVENGGTLSGGGTITAQQGFTISGTVSPDADRFAIPDYDYTTKTFAHESGTVSPDKRIGTLSLVGNTTFSGATLAVDLASASSYDKIAVTGTVGYTGTTVIDLGNFLAGTYNGLVTSTGAMTGFSDYNVTLNAAALGARQKAVAAVVSNSLNLSLTDGHNLDLTWRGGTGNWNTTTENWNYGTNTADRIAFQTNDYVKFDATSAGTVTVQTGGVTVSGMAVSGGTHTLSGGSITGVNVASNGQTVTGTLTVASGARINLAGAATFAGGLANAGTVQLNTGGSFTGDIVNNGTFSIYRNGYTLNNTISGTGTTRFDTNGATLTIAGNAAKNNTFYHRNGNVNLAGTWSGTYNQDAPTTQGVLYGTGTIGGAATLAGICTQRNGPG